MKNKIKTEKENYREFWLEINADGALLLLCSVGRISEIILRVKEEGETILINNPVYVKSLGFDTTPTGHIKVEN